jgi:hypothetical protein
MMHFKVSLMAVKNEYNRMFVVSIKDPSFLIPRVTISIFIRIIFQVPSWKPGAKPLLKSHFCDLSHVGCKGTGQELTFGAEGEVLKVDGYLALNCAVLYKGYSDDGSQKR